MTTYWEGVARTRWGKYLTEVEERTLSRAARMVSGGVALEVGCEGGRWSQLLHVRGFRNICADVSQESLATCQARLPDAECHLVSSADQTWPVASQSVDLLLLYEVNPVATAPWFPAEAARVLRSGGVLVCTIWNPSSMRGLAHRLRQPDDRFYRGPSYRTVRRRLVRQGFNLVHEEGFAWGPFSRDSDSALVPTWVMIEQRLGLRRLVAVSPWVVLIATRT